MMVGSKSFCPECESEIIDAQPAEVPAASAPAKPQASSTPASEGAQSGHVIKDGMGMIEENRTKIGAVETFSDNSVTTHNHTTNTTNISNITQIEDDTKKSVVCEISGRKVLVTSSVVCPVCGKTVAEQYYDESKLRCALCEKKAVEAYENFYKEMTSGSRVIDNELRSVLDSKAKAYKLTADEMKELEFKLRKTQSDKQERLSDIQQKDFDRTIKQLKEDKIAAAPCLNKVSAYAKLTDEASVQCWFWLLSAVVSPENYLKDMKAAVVDNYWQIYWGFVAAMLAKKSTEAVLCVDKAKTKYPDSINDVTLAQAYLEVFQYVETKDSAYLDDAENDLICVIETESRCLQEFRERLKTVLASRATIPSVEKMLLARPVTAPQPVQTAPAAPQAVPQKPAQQKPAPQKPQPQQQTRPAAQPAVQKPAAQTSKGYTLNSAGGPLNPTVTSFSQAQQPKKKGKGGLWVLILILAMGAAAYVFLGKGAGENVADEPAPATKVVEKPVQKPEAKPVEKPVEKPAEKPVVQEPAPVRESAPVQEDRKPTMAEKAVSSAAAKQAATSAPASAPAASQNTDLAKGMEAYKNGDFKTAHDLFKKAATAGDAEACYQLGVMLSTGKGTVTKNTLQAKVWLKKAVSLGHPDAQSVLLIL